MHNIAILPIKKVSTELPNKNFRPFCGKPMYQWVLEECIKCLDIDEVYISSSWEEFRSEIKELYPTVKWVQRPEELNGEVELLEVMKHAATVINNKGATYLQIQINKPLTKAEDISAFLSAFEASNYDSLFQVQEIKTAIDWEYQGSRQEKKKHFKSCSIAKIWNYDTLYQAKAGTWGMGKRHLDYPVGPWHIEVDNIVDYKMAEALKNGGF